MCVHVNTLPDDCLLLIFDRVPQLDLIWLDQICHRWANLLSSACARRRTLKLMLTRGGRRAGRLKYRIPFNNSFDGSFSGDQEYFDFPVLEREASFKLPFLLPHASFDEFLLSEESRGFFSVLYDDSSVDGPADKKFTELARLHHAHLDGQLVTYFVDLLPNVETLVLIHANCDEGELVALNELLGSWPLRVLKLWLRTREIDARYVDRADQHPARALLQSINQQSSLQQLTLDIGGEDHHRYTLPIESYSFIERLNKLKLSLGNYDRNNSIWNTVNRFDSSKLHNIGLDYCYDMQKTLNSKFKFTSKVSQLYNRCSFETVEQLGEFCWRFTSLTMLQVYLEPSLTFAQLVAHLASLTQLTHLHLLVNFRQYAANLFDLSDQVEGDEEPRISLPQVKILALNSNLSHLDFESLSPFVFPSVEKIILRDIRFGCEMCGVYYGHMGMHRCHRLLVRSLSNTFSNSSVRLYVKSITEPFFVDYTNHVFTEEDDLPENGEKKEKKKSKDE